MIAQETILILIISFIAVFVGADIIVNTVVKLAHRLHASSFLVSFLILGFITSLSEVSVAINAYIDQRLEVSVGNLLGGIMILFFLVIPLLSIAGNGVKLQHSFNKLSLILCLAFLVLPSIFMWDSHLGLRESMALGAGYLIIAGSLIFTNTNGKKHEFNKKTGLTLGAGIFKIVIGAIILIIACDQIVSKTITVADSLGVSSFLVSLFMISLGTNLPEISLGLRSVMKGNKDVAFGNYLGSAVFNIFILSILGIANNRITIDSNFYIITITTVIGLAAFYFFATSRKEISRKEGLYLLLLYFIFVFLEIYLKVI